MMSPQKRHPHTKINIQTNKQRNKTATEKRKKLPDGRREGKGQPMKHPSEEKCSKISRYCVHVYMSECVCVCVAFKYLLFLWVDISFLVYCTTYGFVCFV